MQTAATNITHELRMVWNNNEKISWRFACYNTHLQKWQLQKNERLKLKNTKRGTGVFVIV